jgi:anthranilate synthase/aminodeoxychorismate synthase-like glutamine amidotransferase
LILVVDNFDSFTFNLVDYLQQLDQHVEVKRNNLPLDDLLSDQYEGVVLSPGPGIPQNAGHLMKVVDYYITKKPVLGICLGHQAIGEHFEGKLTKAEKPMHGKISEIVHNDDLLFRSIPTNFNVVRYHSLIFKDLPEQLKIIAKTKNGEIMALRHKKLLIYGLQFHPEAILTDFGLQILKNWINLIG